MPESLIDRVGRLVSPEAWANGSESDQAAAREKAKAIRDLLEHEGDDLIWGDEPVYEPSPNAGISSHQRFTMTDKHPRRKFSGNNPKGTAACLTQKNGRPSSPLSSGPS